jgi:nicotinic acid phosphoribosyltransferase
MKNRLLSSALLTDFYELTMGGAYYHNRLEEEGVFELYIRALPPNRS